MVEIKPLPCAVCSLPCTIHHDCYIDVRDKIASMQAEIDALKAKLIAGADTDWLNEQEKE